MGLGIRPYERGLQAVGDHSYAWLQPDGGWGWVVVAASFMAHFIADGCAFSFGVFYEEFLDVFQQTKGETAIIGSLFLSVPLITGPIASAITNKYGCRPTCMMGGFIAGVGLVCSSTVDRIELLFFTFGIVSGIGLSMVYFPAIVIVAFYFEKKRATATGLKFYSRRNLCCECDMLHLCFRDCGGWDGLGYGNVCAAH